MKKEFHLEKQNLFERPFIQYITPTPYLMKKS
jgi:hypothetical protein